MTLVKVPGAKRSGSGAPRGVSEQRIQKTKGLVLELSRRGMTRNDMAAFLEFSPSGVRKYLSDLRAARIVEVHGDHEIGTGQEVYHLVDDAPLVQNFLDSLAIARKVSTKKIRASNLDIALRDKTRSFHLMHDDSYYSVRIRKTTVAPDPLALPATFFAPPPADAEPLQRFHVSIPAAPRGFPAPSASMFRLEVAA